jgi:16S rRNA (guanine527-N7)-methyltransferase
LSEADLAELRHVAGPVSRETFERLKDFEQLFRKWNSRINLVAGSTESNLWRRHILDSAQLARLEPQARRWVDMGSGGGFPGLVMAFVLAERGGSIDLVESNRKKTAFLQAAVASFHLPVRVIAQRIDASHALVVAPEIVTARALAPLTVLLELAEPWLAAGARGLFHKGRDYRKEIEESAHRWRFDLVEHPSLIDDESVVLDIRNLGRV